MNKLRQVALRFALRSSRCGALALLMALPCSLAGQQSEKIVVLEHADSLVGKMLEGENVRELVGHVRFRQGNVTVHCDRAIQYLQSRKVSLLGNVLVRDDTMTMRGRRGMYYSADRIAEAFDGVRLEDGNTVLTADYGRYFVGEKRSFFRGNVLVQDSVSTLKADELTYFRGDKHSIADGNVAIHNIEDNITIYGGHFENYNQQKFSRMTISPKVVQIDVTDGKVDTFTVESRTMESHRDSAQRLVAIDSVRMMSSDLSGEAGHAVYFTALDSIIMRKNPFIWYAESQVSGDSIFIKLKKRKPETVYVRGDAFAISRSDSLRRNRFDQLTGEQITMYFSEGEIQHIDVERTATSIYFLYEDQKDSLGVVRRSNGLNKTSGDRVIIAFVGGRADKISVVGGVEGEYFPENMIEGREFEYYLPGFNWREERPGSIARHQQVLKGQEVGKAHSSNGKRSP